MVWQIFNYGISLVTATGAVAAWVPFFLKKPHLSMYISLQEALGTVQGQGKMEATQRSFGWNLALRIKNCGEKEAKDVVVEVIKCFRNQVTGELQRENIEPRSVSGDLLPNEEITISIPVNEGETKYHDNYIEVILNYRSSTFRLLKSCSERKSQWYFNAKKGVRLSDDLHRVEIGTNQKGK